MGACPFCRAQTLPGDSICYSCGRVISGASGMNQRVRGEFSVEQQGEPVQEALQ